MISEDYQHKNWLDEKNSQYFLENYYDRLPKPIQRKCDLQARLTLITVQTQAIKDDYRVQGGEPF